MNEKKLQSAFGNRIRTLRRSHDFTQAQLAEVLGRSTEYVSHIERGVASPSFEMLGRLANALRVDVKDLFAFEETWTSKRRK